MMLSVAETRVVCSVLWLFAAECTSLKQLLDNCSTSHWLRFVI